MVPADFVSIRSSKDIKVHFPTVRTKVKSTTVKVPGHILVFPMPSVEKGLPAMEVDQAPMADEVPTEAEANSDRGRPRPTACNVSSLWFQGAPVVKLERHIDESREVAAASEVVSSSPSGSDICFERDF